MSDRPPIRPEDVPGGGPAFDGAKLLQKAKQKRALEAPVMASSKALPPSNAPTMRVECPKCGVKFITRREFRPVFCVADTKPAVGDGRGCGWMLFVEPLSGQPEAGKAHALIDLKVQPDGMGSRAAQSKGFVMFAEEMNRRGLVRDAFDLDSGSMGVRLASVKELGL
jgi:hypothetical protein